MMLCKVTQRVWSTCKCFWNAAQYCSCHCSTSSLPVLHTPPPPLRGLYFFRFHFPEGSNVKIVLFLRPFVHNLTYYGVWGDLKCRLFNLFVCLFIVNWSCYFVHLKRQKYISMENISPPPLNKVSWGLLSKEQPILGHGKLLIYRYLKILVHICISFLTLLMYVYMYDFWSRQTILNPCCIETTFLSECITPASTSFLWSALPLSKTFGISLDGCVSLLCHIGQLMIPLYQDSAASIKNTCMCPWIACSPGINPSLWDKEDVAHWLHWAQKEYSLRQPEKGCFEMNGRALCLLTKEDFRRRCPSSGKWVCSWRKTRRLDSFFSFAFIATFLQVMCCMRFCSV